SRLKASSMHADLEKATGQKYGFRALEQNTDAYDVYDETFTPRAVPTGDVRAALDENQPIMFGAGGHRRTIVGYGHDPATGAPVYIALDPYTGGYKLIPQAQLEEGGKLAPSTFTMPGSAAPAPAAGAPAPLDDAPTEIDAPAPVEGGFSVFDEDDLADL